MKVVFFGTAEFAVPSLEAIAESCVLAVSQPDRPSGRGLELRPSPVKLRALELGLPFATPDRARDHSFIEQISQLKPDFLLVAAYGQILPVALLECGRHGGINLHGSILPKYRGAAPIQRCLLNGDHETGVTLMQMEAGMDTGPMIAVERLTIDPNETYGDLQIRLAQLAAQMTTDWKDRLCTGDYPKELQDHDESSHAAKMTKDDATLNWHGNAQSEFNRFRGSTPAPGAVLPSILGPIKLSKIRMAPGTGDPGEVLSLNPLIVAFREGALELVEVQPSGRKRMSGRDFANGARLIVGSNIAYNM